MEEELVARTMRYIEWCDSYRVKPLDEVVVSFRLKQPSLVLPKSTRPTDVLAVMEMLKHDSIVTSLDVSGAAIGDAGAFALADGIAGGAALRELVVSAAGVGEAGAAAIFKAALRSLYLRRLDLSHNQIGLAGRAALLTLLRKTRALHDVDVRSCGLGSRGLREITSALLERATAREGRRAEREAARTGIAAPPYVPAAQKLGSRFDWLMGGFGGDDKLVVTNNFRVKLVGGTPGTREEGPNGGGSTPPRPRAPTGSALADGVDDDDTIDVTVQIGGNYVTLERISSAVHGLGLALTLLAAFPLLSKGRDGDALELVSYVVFIAGLVNFWLTALLAHSLYTLDESFFRKLLQPAAFFLIAATYTPFLLNSFRPVRGSYVFLIFVWAISAVGSLVAGSCEPGRMTHHALSLLYLLVGYSGSLVGLVLPSCLPAAAWQLLFGGGALFTFGVFVYARDRPTNALVPVWYAMVLLGILMNFFVVYTYIETPHSASACVADARSLGLAVDPADTSPAFFHSDGASALNDAAREILSASSAFSQASRRALSERLAGVLREVIKQIEHNETDL